MTESMTIDSATITLMVLRWIHFIFGITWIGLLYFFNFVNVPLGKVLDGPTKKSVVPQLMPRALWWFRWAAMITFLSGWIYVFGKMHLNQQPIAEIFSSTWGQWIVLGGTLASIMWFNVWFVIWPNQKKIIGWVKGGLTPPEMAATVKTAFLASRINTYLSVPMLFCMGAASHFPAFNLPILAVVTVVSAALVWHLVEKVAPKAGANF